MIHSNLYFKRKDIFMKMKIKIKDRIQAIKDSIFPRNLGYVNCKFSPVRSKELGLPDGLPYDCYMPKDLAKKLLDGDSRELTTDDFASVQIYHFKKDKPEFKGIIWNPVAATSLSDNMAAMHIYANTYNVPVGMRFNGSYHFIEPDKTIIMSKMNIQKR